MKVVKRVRDQSGLYYFGNYETQKIQVCQKFFLATLGFTHDKTVKNALKSKAVNNKIVPFPDKRGKCPLTNKLSGQLEVATKDLILSYNPFLSHYRLQHATIIYQWNA